MHFLTSRGTHRAQQSSARSSSAQASATVEPVEPSAADSSYGIKHSGGEDERGPGASMPLHKQNLKASEEHDPPPSVTLEAWLRDAHELCNSLPSAPGSAVYGAIKITRCATWLEHVNPEHLGNEDARVRAIDALAALVKGMPDTYNVAAGPLLAAAERALERHGMRDEARAAPTLRAAVAALIAAAAWRERTYRVQAELSLVARVQWRYHVFEPAYWVRVTRARTPAHVAGLLVASLSALRADLAQPDEHRAACALALRAVRGAVPASVARTIGWLAAWGMPLPTSAEHTILTSAAASAMQRLGPSECAILLHNLVKLRVPVSAKSSAGIACGIEQALTCDDVARVIRTVINAKRLRMLRSAAWPALKRALERIAPRLTVFDLKTVLITMRTGQSQLHGAAGAAMAGTVAREAAAIASPHLAASLLQLLPQVLPGQHEAAAGALAAAGSRHVDGMSPACVTRALGGAARLHVHLGKRPDSLRAFCTDATAVAARYVHTLQEHEFTSVCIALRTLHRYDTAVDAELALALAAHAEAVAPKMVKNSPAHALSAFAAHGATLDARATHALLAAAARCWHDMDGHGVATTLHAAAKLGLEPPEAIRQKVSPAVQRTASTMTARDVAQLLDALPVLDHSLSGSPLRALHARVADLAPRLSARMAAHVAAGMASARRPISHACARALLRAALLRTLPAMKPAHVSITLQSLPRLWWFVDAALQRALAAAALRAAPDFSARGAANALFGLARLQVVDPSGHCDALDAAFDALERSHNELEPFEAGLALHACACIRATQPGAPLPALAPLVKRACDAPEAATRVNELVSHAFTNTG
jgi:hypothetical protein